MFLAVDIGGTKTLVASFTQEGKLSEQVRFKTPANYSNFTKQLKEFIDGLSSDRFTVAVVAIPGMVDRRNGRGIAFGNLGWENAPIKHDVQAFLRCPVLVENDANLAGLSEARNTKDDYKRVLYLTVSTGIGSGVITDGIIDPDLQDSEAGQMMVQYNDRMQIWEDIASGSAIVKRYGKIAADISSKQTWQEICHRLALGMNSLIATLQPDAVIIGGGVGTHFKKYGRILQKELEKYATPLTPVPPILPAKHAEQAVIFGCYELAHDYYEKTHR